LISQLYRDQLIEAQALDQITCFQAGLQFARTEGILPAPEANHAIAAAIQEAEEAKATGEQRTIVFNLCGHGHFDMAAYDAYFEGKLAEHHFTNEALQANLRALDNYPSVG
jgi:tryptophan synthase beta chain